VTVDLPRRSGLRRICLALPTNRECVTPLVAITAEASYAATEFGVEVCLLVLDSCERETFAEHAAVLRDTVRAPGVQVIHLDEAAQRRFLLRTIDHAGVAKPDLVLDLMLPAKLSYGACTNRAFLIARALGCESIHRRDSDTSYQDLDGAPVFPIHQELVALGRPAKEASDHVSQTELAPRHAQKPVVMAGAAIIGELTVDIAEIRDTDPEVYYDIVSLWAAEGTSEAEKRALVDESFTGAGSETFTGDQSILTLVDPMRVEMSNISFYRVQEEVPLPPGADTIGTDYFLLHLIHDAALPGVLHNRHVVNYYTPERRTDDGFRAYQLRYVKFLLSMLYLHAIYQRLAQTGESMLGADGLVRSSLLADIVRGTVGLDQEPNVRRLEVLQRSYRKLGGRYADFAELLVGRQEELLMDARSDIEDFATLIEVWAPLMRAGEETGVDHAWQ
jgi:hypothetical protein